MKRGRNEMPDDTISGIKVTIFGGQKIIGWGDEGGQAQYRTHTLTLSSGNQLNLQSIG